MTVNADVRNKVKDILLKSLKPSVLNELFVLEGNAWNIKISTTRSSAIMINNLAWHDRSKNQKNSIFIKITPHVDPISSGMAASEIKLYNTTSKAMDYGLSRHFVKCFNDELVKNNHVTIDTPMKIGTQMIDMFSILIIEYLGKHNMPLQVPMVELLMLEKKTDDRSKTYRRRINNILNVLILQVIHTLYVFHLLGIKHLDLHYGNIVVVPSVPGRYVNKYAISTDKQPLVQGRSSSKIMYLPNVGYEIRIIDYDGAVKMDRRRMIDPRYPPIFKNPIPNVGLYSIGYKNVKDTYLQNFYKVMAAPVMSKQFMQKYGPLLKTNYSNINSLFTINNQAKKRIFEFNARTERITPDEKNYIKKLQNNHKYFIRANGVDINNTKLLMSPMDFLLQVVDKEFNTIPDGFTVHQYANNALYYLPSNNNVQKRNVNSVSVSVVRSFDKNKFLAHLHNKNESGNTIMKNAYNVRNNLARGLQRINVQK